MSDRGDFTEALMAAPLGAVVLALIEGKVRDDVPWYFVPPDTDGDAVRRAADAVRTWSFGSLVELAVYASYMQVGPWISSQAPATAATAYRHVEERLPIAEAVDEVFAPALHQPVDVAVQEWWNSAAEATGLHVARRFDVYESVYGAGQFTWAGLWTVTRPPAEVQGELVAAWELEQGPVSRWHLPVRPDVRVFEVHRPEDWARLVTQHPAEARPNEEWWELPGRGRPDAAPSGRGWSAAPPTRNQRGSDLTPLLAIPGQRAARATIRRHLVPDWRRVAEDHDGVHLSWAGFITSEGCIVDLGPDVGDGDVAMLRYWFSERTHWLRDVFGEPEPLAAPETEASDIATADVRTDTSRLRHDELVLRAQLGR